jgi:putative membrane protein
MLLASSVSGLFKWRQFELEVILLAVGWYLRFSLSYRDVEELLATRLAYDRTRLACEAWVRTATTLIAFGFSIYTFFQIQLKGVERREYLISPREVGLFMITCGLVSLLLGTVQNMLSLRQISAQWPEAPRSLATALGAVIAILGIVTFVVTILRR